MIDYTLLCHQHHRKLLSLAIKNTLSTFLPAILPHVHRFKKFFSPAHTHPFNSPLSETTQVSRYQKGKTRLDFTEARDSEWQWHQLGMCKSAPRSRQITTPTPHHSFFTGRMPFLPPNQQRQSTEGTRQYSDAYKL